MTDKGISYSISYGDRSINTEQVGSVWMRRIWTPTLSQDLKLQYREACIRQSQTTLNCFLDSLSKVPWIDRLEKIKAAENKMRQLRIAKELGISLPPTLITNDPQQVKAFFSRITRKDGN